jgi:colanic acid/amylovoran biosynthesis glycosyltransferase
MAIENIGDKSICIVSGSTLVSETFIREHERRLSGNKHVLHGGYPHYQHNGKSLIASYGKTPIQHKLARLLPDVIFDKLKLGRSHQQQAEQSLENFLINKKVGCVLAEYGQTGADLTPLLRKHSIPLLVYFHGHDAYHREYVSLYKDRFEKMFQYASAIFVVSEHMKNQVAALGASETKIILNPCAPREHFFELTISETLNILALGRFVETKAPYLTLLAFSKIVADIPTARLTFLGDGPMLPVCRDMAIALKIDKSIDFLGSVEPTLTAEFFRNSRLFVQHSITTSEGVMEGTPVAILEASAAGLPIVATRHAGIEQAVIDGVSGFLVQERDINAMSHAMKTLLLDYQLARSMGEAGRQHIKYNYNFDTHTRLIQTQIDKCLSATTK